MKKNQLVKAYHDYSKCIVLDSTDTDVYFNRANCTFYLGEFSYAISDLEKLLSMKPKDYEAHYLKSLCHLNMKDSLLTLSALDSASKYARYHKNTHEEYLTLAQMLNSKDDCIRAKSRLIKYDYRNAQHILDRANLYMEQEKYELAIKDLQTYIKRVKRNGKAHYLLGKCYWYIGDEHLMEKHKRKASKLGFKPPN